jgi:uncharacterized membrane protein
MGTGRLEAFSDGVLAIIITIMVLEVHVPDDPTWHAFADDTLPMLGIYALSFLYVGIYWNNHHHMLQLTDRVSGGVLWANLHLLFWLSVLPFTTKWMGETDFAEVPVIVYGLNLLAAAIAYFVLQQLIIAIEGPGSRLKTAVGGDAKGKLSPVIYLVGIAGTLLTPAIGIALFAFAALIWLVPDRRIEHFTADVETAQDR